MVDEEDAVPAVLFRCDRLLDDIARFGDEAQRQAMLQGLSSHRLSAHIEFDPLVDAVLDDRRIDPLRFDLERRIRGHRDV